VWLKRAIGEIYPDIFLNPLTPKKNEIVAYTIDKSWDESKEFFEKMLKNSFKEINRVLKPNGIAIIVYAHKTTEGWETVINSLIDSGLTVTASWPLSTERKSRQRAQNSAALRSSIYIVARKFEKKDIGWYSEIKDEIRNYIPKKLDKLWEEGISGADFFIAAIGSAIEVFGKYKKVMDNKGNEIRAKSLLSFVRSVVTNYTVKQILENGIADELSSITKFYILWRWNYQEASVEFDEARKLAQSAGIDLANEWNKGLIIKRSSSIRVLGPDKRDIDSLEDLKN
jgi:adenine-specific DNA methylase